MIHSYIVFLDSLNSPLNISPSLPLDIEEMRRKSQITETSKGSSYNLYKGICHPIGHL